jgi:hypothetical protein
MQLKISILTCALLASTAMMAEDYINIQFMGYDEESGKTTIYTPAIEINKDFGADYTFNLSLTHDSVSGASPTFYDAFSGASAKIPEGVIYKEDITYGDIDYEDKRKAVALSLTKRFASRDELTIGANYSDEYDYTSNEISAEYLHYLDNSKNRAISLGASYQDNDVSIYCDLGTSACDTSSGASQKVKNLKVFSTEVGFTQIIDQTSLVKTSLFYINEDGYLSNPYMRVVRDYNISPKITEEVKPDSRTAYGATLQYIKALNKKLSSISSYRFYDDDWDITSHTIEEELNYEWSEKLTTGVMLRYYTQSKAKFYSGKKDYFTNQKYASSDRRMSDFDAINLTLDATYHINQKISCNTSISYYEQFDIFEAYYYGLGIKYKF